MRIGVNMNREEFEGILEREARLDQALERMEAGDFLSDDDVSIIRWACGKTKHTPQKELNALFQDWATVFRINGAI